MTQALEQIKQYLVLAKEQAAKLPEQQRQWLIVLAPFLLLLGIFLIFSPLQSLFQDQTTQITATTRDIRALPALFHEYTELAKRKNTLEKEYQEVRIQEGELVGQVEALIKNTAGIKEGFSVREPTTRELGGNYKKLSVTVSNLRVSNFPKFVEFLDQLVSGDKRLLLERIDINKSSLGDFLLVSLDISSIQRAQH